MAVINLLMILLLILLGICIGSLVVLLAYAVLSAISDRKRMLNNKYE